MGDGKIVTAFARESLFPPKIAHFLHFIMKKSTQKLPFIDYLQIFANVSA